MKIKEILLNQGFLSKDVDLRFKNNQIKLNGVSVKNINLDINDNFIFELGDFLFLAFSKNELRFINIINTEGIEFLFEGNSNINCLDFLDSFYCLSVSKKEKYVLMKN